MADKHLIFACGAALAVAAALLGGCAQVRTDDAAADVPQVVPHAPLLQQSTRALQHWNVLAGDVAAHVAARLRDWPAGEYPMQIVAEPGASGFERGLRELLATQLVERGVAVSTEPQELRLRVLTQLVQHHAGAPLQGVAAQQLEHGVRVWRGVAQSWEAAGEGLPMRTEVLVITSLERAGQVLVRTSDMYSVPQADAPLYQNRTPATAAAAGTAPGAAQQGALRQWKVVP